MNKEKFTELTKLMDDYSNTVVSIKNKIKDILKENGNIVKLPENSEYELPCFSMIDEDGENDLINIESIEVIGKEIYINGVSEYTENNVSYEATDEMLYWIVKFIELYT